MNPTKKCRCGFQKGDPSITVHKKHSLWGWFLMAFLGMTAIPKEIYYQCERCQDVIERITDPEFLKENRLLD